MVNVAEFFQAASTPIGAQAPETILDEELVRRAQEANGRGETTKRGTQNTNRQ